jgi:tryptophan-rich sensory protein
VVSDWTALIAAVGICLAVGLLEVLLTSDGLKTWYPTLRKPCWHIPLWGFILVGVAVYVLDGFVAYRLLTVVDSRPAQVVALIALLVVMVTNALWNYAFFAYQSTLIGWLGLVGFLGPLLTLQVVLFANEPVAAFAHAAYLVWVVAYDIPLFFMLWRMNPQPGDATK